MLGLKKTREIFYMARDFVKIVRGKDYFHEPARLGSYFKDDRCYYYDFRAKVNWTGRFEAGVPLLNVPAWSREIFFPIMIMQFGLGCLDEYFLTGEPRRLESALSVVRWMLNKHQGNGSFDNYFPQISPQYQHYSANSALAQGHALSILSRVNFYHLVPADLSSSANELMTSVFENMIAPIDAGGTALIEGDDIYFCEVCRRDNCVVLNGWIYAIFGLWDYQRFYPGERPSAILRQTLVTLENHLDEFILPGGWSIYDNKGRLCSPTYNELHIVLMDALARLTKSKKMISYLQKLNRGQTKLNQIRFTVLKIREKLKDKHAYLTH